MEIKIVDQTGSEIKETPFVAGEPVSPTSSDEITKISVGDVFGAERGELQKHSKSINTLIEYARTQTEDPTPDNIKWAIRQLYFKLGTPPLGENAITYTARYAFLALEKNKLDKELEKFKEMR